MRDGIAGDFLNPVGAGAKVCAQVAGYHVLTIFIGSEDAGNVGDETYADVAGIIGTESAVLVTAAGGDEDNARVCTRTVNSCSRAVFEDVDGLNVRGLDR